MHKRLIFALMLILVLLLTGCGSDEPPAVEEPGTEVEEPSTGEEAPAMDEKATIVIESWRNDDLTIWQDTIIPAFNVHYPNIEVIFSPTAPAEYNAALNAKLEGGSAGDLITCRPFDASRSWEKSAPFPRVLVHRRSQ